MRAGQVTYYDDIGAAYEWAVKLPVAAVSLDFLGVPGSAFGNETAALIEKCARSPGIWPPPSLLPHTSGFLACWSRPCPCTGSCINQTYITHAAASLQCKPQALGPGRASFLSVSQARVQTLLRRYGFPSDKRLGAGVVDGRSVFSDGDVPANLVSALLAKARTPAWDALWFALRLLFSGGPAAGGQLRI